MSPAKTTGWNSVTI